MPTGSRRGAWRAVHPEGGPPHNSEDDQRPPVLGAASDSVGRQLLGTGMGEPLSDGDRPRTRMREDPEGHALRTAAQLPCGSTGHAPSANVLHRSITTHAAPQRLQIAGGTPRISGQGGHRPSRCPAPEAGTVGIVPRKRSVCRQFGGRSMHRAGGACPGSVPLRPDAMVSSDGNPACVRAKCAPGTPVTAGPGAADGRATVAGGSTRVLTRPGSGQVFAARPATAPTAERPRRRHEVACPLAYCDNGLRRVAPPARGGSEVGMHR